MKSSKKKILKGGVADYSPLSNPCNKNVDVSQYMAPCKYTDNIQSGHNLLKGGKRSSRKRSRLQRGGCGDSIQHCMGANYPSLGQMTGQTGQVSASEMAWCYRNVYGATPSTNELQKGGRPVGAPSKKTLEDRKSKGKSKDKSKKRGGRPVGAPSKKTLEDRKSKGKPKKSDKSKKGGGYFLEVDQSTLGGLARVASRPEPIQPRTTNYNIVSPFPRVNDRYNNVQYGGNEQLGNFSPNMDTRAFNCNQPNWCPDCV
jgi:hypothetical protein